MTHTQRVSFCTILTITFISSLFFITVTHAQAVCGAITDAEGNVSGYDNCDNPFNAETGFPFELYINETAIHDNGAYQLPLDTPLIITLTEITSEVPVEVTLYEHEGANRFEVPVTEDELGDGYETTFERTGTYTLVIGAEDSISQIEDASSFATLRNFLFPVVHAQEVEVVYTRTFTVLAEDVPDCGTITNLGGEVTTITDCDNPFNEDTSFSHIVTNSIADTLIGEDVEVVVSSEQEAIPWMFDFEGNTARYFSNAYLYKKNSDDYIEIARLQGPSATQNITITESGTYSVVSVIEDVPVLSQHKSSQYKSWWSTLKQIMLPRALAYFTDRQQVQQLTFTITVEEPEPEGVSSVLFLPGIQASRLYLGDGTQVSDRLWEPDIFGGNNDVRLLELDENGQSIIDIRTYDVIDDTAYPFFWRQHI